MNVGAIWRVNSKYSVKLDLKWKDGLFIFLSEDSKHWCGWTWAIISTNDVPGIGKPLPELGRNPIDRILYGPWEQVRLDLINNRLGEPVEGTNPLLTKVKIQSGVCTCGYYTALRNGCPTAHGGVCPNIQD